MISARPENRKQTAGALLALMIVFAVLHGILPLFPAWPSGLAAWGAALLLWQKTSKMQRLQAMILAGLGALVVLWSVSQGVNPTLERIIDQNHALLSMLAAVTFLRLVSLPQSGEGERAPRGWPAYWRTLAGIHLFGAVINLSAVAIVADCLGRRGSFDRRTAVLISRGFSSASMWSPFFAGMAVVLTYVPGAKLPILMAAGFPLALCGLLYTFIRERFTNRAHPVEFVGYPMHFESLWVPGLLATCVLLTHFMVPDWSILTTISLLAPALSFAILWRRSGANGALCTVRRHVFEGLPDMSSELILFVAAGISAVGLAGLFSSFGGWLPSGGLSGLNATLILIIMVGLSAMGIHPIISITTVAAWLSPLDPDPTLLGMVFLMTWGIGVAASPLSATHLMIQGRYGIESWRYIAWNMDYCVFLLLLGAVTLNLYANWG